MNFNDGDVIKGHYGNTYRRVDGVWMTSPFDFTQASVPAFGDATAEWLINLRVENTLPKPKGLGKLSKTETETHIYVYRYTYFPGGLDA